MYICVNINQTNYTMKKLNYLFAIVALFAFTACGSSSEKAAEEVVSTGDSVSLEPMSSTDRRVVHVLFENHHDIITKSEGEGDGRHIVLMKREDDQ